jgi:hypothetical protein
MEPILIFEEVDHVNESPQWVVLVGLMHVLPLQPHLVIIMGLELQSTLVLLDHFDIGITFGQRGHTKQMIMKSEEEEE